MFERLQLQLGVGHAGDSQGTAGVDLAFAQGLARGLAQIKQLEPGVHVAAAFADLVGHLVSVDFVVLHQPLVALGFFELGEVVALEVFNELDFEHLVVTEAADQRRDGGHARLHAGPVAPLAADNFMRGHHVGLILLATVGFARSFLHPAAGQRPHKDRLVHTAGLDAFGQLSELDRVETLARVGQAGDQGVDGQVGELVFLGGGDRGVVGQGGAGVG